MMLSRADSDSFSFEQFVSHRSVLDRLDWFKMNVPMRSSHQEMPVDNPPGNDETLAVIDERERRMREGAERDVSRIPWGPRRVRLASGLWSHGIETQLNFKMICATPRSSPPFLANIVSVVAAPP